MEQQGIPYKIGMSESPYHVWIIRGGRALEPGFGYAPEEWYVAGVDYSSPWQTFSSVAALRFWAEGDGDAKVYWFNNLSDLQECDTNALKRFIHCD
jgi:hypothetical protein